ncbi:MAG TPA: hypothetical protein VK249_32330 [Anaerolineales bacterium]|nr:hypothetical protein [Anaerolineales bacterium]
MIISQMLVALLTSYLSHYFVVGLAWLAGMILAIVYWRRNPKVSRFTLIAIVIFLVESCSSSYVGLYLPLRSRDWGLTGTQLGLYLSLFNILASLMSAVAWGFILAAIFGRRDQA